MNTISVPDDELLKYAIENGILDAALVRDKIEMMKREEILKKHCYSIWYNDKEKSWYTYIPDITKKDNRRKVKRKEKRDIENIICQYYQSAENKENSELLTVEKLFYEFMEHKSKEVNSGTIKRMMADWERFYKPNTEFIHTPVKNITRITIDDFFNDVLEKYDLKKKAFYNMCGLLKQSLEYAIDAEYIEKNPYRIKVNKKKFVNSNKKPSTKEVYQKEEKELFIEEMERRLDNNPSNTAILAVLLDFELGTRKGEILAICKSDIAGDKIHIHRQLVEEFDTSDLNDIKSLGFRIVDYTKSEDGDRWLPLTERAKELIRRVEYINEKYDYSYKDLLFARNNSFITPDAIDAQVKRGCEHIGIPVKTMHKIRKTYASTLLHNGVNISIVKDMLGHADESTTLKHYIYNIEDSTETDRLVRNALSGDKKVRSDQSDQNIVEFRKIKKLKTQ